MFLLQVYLGGLIKPSIIEYGLCFLSWTGRDSNEGLPRPKFNKDVMNKVFYPELSDQEDEVYTEREREIEKEENFMNLWGYLRRRYPNETLEEKKFSDLINLKIHLEGPRRLREWTEDIASVRKH